MEIETMWYQTILCFKLKVPNLLEWDLRPTTSSALRVSKSSVLRRFSLVSFSFDILWPSTMLRNTDHRGAVQAEYPLQWGGQWGVKPAKAPIARALWRCWLRSAHVSFLRAWRSPQAGVRAGNGFLSHQQGSLAFLSTKQRAWPR